MDATIDPHRDRIRAFERPDLRGLWERGAVIHRERAWLIESQDWGDGVNYPPIAKLYQQLARRPPDTMGTRSSAGACSRRWT